MQKEEKVDVKRTMPFIILHGCCLLVFVVGFNWFAVTAAVLFYVVRMFAITAFYHRYFSHRAYKTSRIGQFLFAVIGNTACQRGALWWASTHRHHHKHSDDEHDIHSPRQKGFWWSHLGWITSQRNFPTDYSRIKDLAKFPELVFLNRHDMLVPVLTASVIYGLGVLLETHAPGLQCTAGQLFVWCFFVSTVALMHGTFLSTPSPMCLAAVAMRRRTTAATACCWRSSRWEKDGTTIITATSTAPARASSGGRSM